MKFASAIVLLAIAFAVDGNLIPLSAVPWTQDVSQPSLTVSQPVVAARLVPAWNVAPAVQAYAAPVAVVAAPVAVEGQYVAANRGAVHVAPLPGHSQSASSVNLEAAPGTW